MKLMIGMLQRTICGIWRWTTDCGPNLIDLVNLSKYTITCLQRVVGRFTYCMVSGLNEGWPSSTIPSTVFHVPVPLSMTCSGWRQERSCPSFVPNDLGLGCILKLGITANLKWFVGYDL